MSRKVIVLLIAVGVLIAGGIVAIILATGQRNPPKDAGGESGKGSPGGTSIGPRAPVQRQFFGVLERTMKTICLSNLRSIGVGVIQYSSMTGSYALPPSFDALSRARVTLPEAFICPKLKEQDIRQRYSYLPDVLLDAGIAAIEANDPATAKELRARKAELAQHVAMALPLHVFGPDTPLAWDAWPTHEENWQVNVLFADGSVRSLPPMQAADLVQKAVRELQDRVRPALTLPASAPAGTAP